MTSTQQSKAQQSQKTLNKYVSKNKMKPTEFLMCLNVLRGF